MRKLILIMLFLSGFAVFDNTIPASATTVTVTTLADELNTDGDCSLREAIQAVNTNSAVDACPSGSVSETDTIVLLSGTYTFTLRGGSENANLRGDYDIVGNVSTPVNLTLSVAGGGTATIQANDLDRILEMGANTTLTINGINFNNGNSTIGGAIRNNGGNLTINHSLLTNHFGLNSGGAVYNANGGVLTVNNSTFRNNYSIEGGAINNNASTLNVTGSTFGGSASFGNTAASGGAVYALGGSTTNITNSTFTYNMTLDTMSALGQDGGAIVNRDSAMTITGSTFSFNTSSSDDRAGAISNETITNQAVLTVDSSTFTNNSAGFIGGAISSLGSFSVDSILNIQNNTYIGTLGQGNSASSAGGVYAADSTVTIMNSFVLSNINGGLSSFSATYSVTNTQFRGNTAGSGAAISIGSSSQLDVYNSLFESNSASAYGGAIAAGFDSQVRIHAGTVFGNVGVGNSADKGGAIYTDDANLTIDDAIFSDNTATSYGGALYIYRHVTTITDSTFGSSVATGNSAANGGAIFMDGGSFNMQTSTVAYNQATAGGGGFHFRTVNAFIGNSSVHHNTANSGGALYTVDFGSASFHMSTVYSNSATLDGGAVYSDSNFGLNQTTLGGTGTGNSAGRNGGGIYSSDNTSVLNSLISDNSAASGGAIYHLETGLTVTGSQILNNTATGNGGGILSLSNASAAVFVNNSCIVDNSDIGVVNLSASVQDATSNWWGAVDGPGPVGSGAGDTLSNNWTYSGFLTSPILGCPNRTRPTATPTLIPTLTYTPSPTPTPSDTPTPTNTFTPTATYTPSNTPTGCVIAVTAPNLISPAHRSHTTDTTPTFTWSNVANAQSYRVMVYLEDRSFEFKKRIFVTNYTMQTPLVVSKYLWRVRTQDQACSTWSGWSSRNTLFID